MYSSSSTSSPLAQGHTAAVGASASTASPLASSSSLKLPAEGKGVSHECRNGSGGAEVAAPAQGDEAPIASYPVLDRNVLYVSNTPSAGRGVFAAVPLIAGTLVEVSHVLLFEAGEYQQHGQHTQLDSYTYVWTKSAQGNTMALALGLGSLFNHSSSSPNVSFALDRKAGTIRYTLARNVSAGEELLICYGLGKMWWEEHEGARDYSQTNGLRSTDGNAADSSSSEMDDGINSSRQGAASPLPDDADSELFMLGQLGLEHDERDVHERRRRAEERRQQLLLFSSPLLQLHHHEEDGTQTGDSSRSTSLQRGADNGQLQQKQVLPPARVLPAAVGPEKAPLWRITAALDPNTTPLELMPVWAVRIDPRKSENYMAFSRNIARRLRAAEWGDESSMQHRSSSQNDCTNNDSESDRGSASDDDAESDGSSDEEDESMKHLRLFQRIEDGRGLNALVCRVQDMPSFEKVVALLKTADLVPDGTQPCPYRIQVPRHPAPSRDRLPEWKMYWPVSVKGGKVNNTLLHSSLSGASQASPGSAAPGVVDRAADARLWTEAARRWATVNFRKALAQAHLAQKRGELPIGVHVTSSFPDGDHIASGVAEGQTSIEVDACDTRKSERNPIKHAVTNAIRDVAKVRSERDWERLLILNAKVAHLHRDPNVDPNAHRLALQRAEALVAERGLDQALTATALSSANANTTATANGTHTASSSNVSTPQSSSSNSRILNGQDYLLNNLTLFTTHEPCVSCCMALVHSRVRAVCFIEPSPGAGGCCGSGLDESRQCAFAQDGGPYAVQEQAGLNHRFDVWRWVGNDSDLLEQASGAPSDASGARELAQNGALRLPSVRLDISGLDV